jgi:hypothetical protein
VWTSPGTISGITIFKDATYTGILNWVTNSGTELDVGNIIIQNGASMRVGTTSTKIAADKTATISIDCSGVDGKFGIQNYGELTIQGDDIPYDWCLLNSDVSGSETSITVDISTGWSAGDVIGIAPTQRNNAHSESMTISGVDGTTIYLTSAISNPHSGTSPTQAQVINLTRNAVIQAKTSANPYYITCFSGSSVDADYALFKYIGANVTDKEGFDIQIISGGEANLSHCAFSGGERYHVRLSDGANAVIDNCMMYGAGHHGILIGYTTGHAITNNIVMNAGWYSVAGAGINGQRIYSTITGNIVTGSWGSGFWFECGKNPHKEFFNNTAHNNGSGFFFRTVGNDELYWMSGITAWRNEGYGMTLRESRDILLDNYTAFGNTGHNLVLTSDTIGHIYKNLIFDGDSSYATCSSCTTGYLYLRYQ